MLSGLPIRAKRLHRCMKHHTILQHSRGLATDLLVERTRTCVFPLSRFRASHSATRASLSPPLPGALQEGSGSSCSFSDFNLNLSSSRHSLGQAASGFSLLVDLNTLREKAAPKQSEPDSHTCHHQAGTSVLSLFQGDLMSRKLLHTLLHNERKEELQIRQCIVYTYLKTIMRHDHDHQN